jgi:hypothetical protein
MEAPAWAHLQDRREERGRGGRDEGGGGRRQGTSPALLNPVVVRLKMWVVDQSSNLNLIYVIKVMSEEKLGGLKVEKFYRCLLIF